MNESEYVVPPTTGPSNVSGSAPKSPKKPNKAVVWVKSNVAVTVAGSVTAFIVILFGVMAVTNQKLEFAGINLNPLYNQASEPKCTDNIQNPCPNPVGETLETFRIDGSFADGTVNVPYTQVFTVNPQTYSSVGGPIGMCTWGVISMAPKPTFETSFVQLAGGPGTTSTFKATPTVAGTYQVTIKVSCNNTGQETTKTLPWVVKGATSGVLSISGTFGEGLVGQDYKAVLQAINPGTAVCTFELVSVTPPIAGARVGAPDATTNSDQAAPTAWFTAKPTNAGSYVARVSVTCNPRVGDGPSKFAQKDFPFTVKINLIDPPPSGELSINATFANGKVVQAYTTSVSTVNGASNCNLELVSVNPTISGAMLDKVSNVGGNPSSSALASFKATPTTAGTYTIKLSATCAPLVGDGPTRFVEKSFTWIVDTATTGGGGGSGGGPKDTANACVGAPGLIPIYRWWNDRDKDHFYTTNVNEKPPGFISEGISGYVFKEKVSGSTAVYRSYSAQLTAHYYSTVNDAEKYGYKTEGVLGYAFASTTSGAVPWYRLHKGWSANDYLETISTKEKAEAIAAGYADAGTAAYICGSKS